MVYRIAIIGAGQLGSRHLQGLKLAQLPMTITVVDSLQDSLNIAKSRYEDVAENPLVNSIEYVRSVDLLPAELDLVIVATGSAPRRTIIENLLSMKKVKNLVLEKFLFQSLIDYDVIEQLLADKGLLSNTWVNCPRRMFDYYPQIKTEFVSLSPLTMEVKGAGWGLACNSVHFIDILAYITSQENWCFSGHKLGKMIKSRRTGYVEFLGEVTGKSDRGDSIRLVCDPIEDQLLSIVIAGGGKEIIVDEINSRMIWTNTGIEKNIANKYQSSLTKEIAEQILLEGRSELTSYFESAKLHKAFLEILIPYYSNLCGKPSDSCPIT